MHFTKFFCTFALSAILAVNVNGEEENHLKESVLSKLDEGNVLTLEKKVATDKDIAIVEADFKHNVQTDSSAALAKLAAELVAKDKEIEELKASVLKLENTMTEGETEGWTFPWKWRGNCRYCGDFSTPAGLGTTCVRP